MLGTLSQWCNINFSATSAYAISISNPTYYTNELVIQGKEITDLIIPEDVTKVNIL